MRLSTLLRYEKETRVPKRRLRGLRGPKDQRTQGDEPHQESQKREQVEHKAHKVSGPLVLNAWCIAAPVLHT